MQWRSCILLGGFFSRTFAGWSFHRHKVLSVKTIKRKRNFRKKTTVRLPKPFKLTIQTASICLTCAIAATPCVKCLAWPLSSCFGFLSRGMATVLLCWLLPSPSSAVKQRHPPTASSFGSSWLNITPHQMRTGQPFPWSFYKSVISTQHLISIFLRVEDLS